MIKTHISSTSETRNMKVQDQVVPISHRQKNEKQVTLPMKIIAHKYNRIFETVKNLTWEKTIK